MDFEPIIQAELLSLVTQLLDVLEAKDESFSKHVMKVWEICYLLFLISWKLLLLGSYA